MTQRRRGVVSDDRLIALSAFASELQVDALPPNAVEAAKAAILYGLAVGVASTESPLLQTLGAVADGWSDGSNATRFMDGGKTGARAAAMANGALLHIRMQEDAHPAGHVGVVILPAAIAEAEAVGADGGALLAAVAAGYEIALRIGRDHASALSGRGFRTTPIYGAMGAAVAASRLRNRSSEETANALSLAANMAGGLREFQEAGTTEYALHAGLGAQNGLMAAALAGAGVPAAHSVLSGKAGFYAAYGDKETDFGARLLDELGEVYELERLTYKPYPGGQFHRNIIGGLKDMRARADGRDISAIHIRLNSFVANFPGLQYAGPFETYSQAFYSIPFCAALTWVDGTVGFRGLHRFDDERLLSIIPRVEVITDDDRPVYDPKIDVVLADGDVFEWAEESGEDAYRLNWASATAMARQLGDEVGVTPEVVGRLIDAVDGLAVAPGVDTLVESVCRAVAEAKAAA
jgi:2-methylcitrate dehydratase PrpD